MADKTDAEFIADFLAEDHSDTTPEPEPSNEAEGDEADEAPEAAEADGAEGVDDEDAEGDGEPHDEADAPAPKLDVKALTKAIEADDPKAFIAALGKKAETLLGAKAHKALRLAAKELKAQTARADKVIAGLNEKFGDPIAVRKAAEAGDMDTVVDGIERQIGASWEAIVKAVNDSFAGKPARLQAKATAAKAQTEAQQAAAAKVREAITVSVRSADAKLLKAFPRVVDLVFEKMRAEFKNGVDTPAKALAAVKKELLAEHKALSPVLTAKTNEPAPRAKPRPPRETRESEGRPLSEDEFRREFLREHGNDSKFRRAR